MKDRQHYVFLDSSDSSEELTIEGDETIGQDMEWHIIASGAFANAYHHIRRKAQPTAQPTETCPWRRSGDKGSIQNPHMFTWHYDDGHMICCNTCGKRIEVVE